MKKTKKIDLGTIVLLLIFIIVLFCYCQLKVLHYEYINFCGYTIFQVITGSMEPTIKTKDLVIEKITQDVDIDDIITYKSGNDFVTHRIIQKNDNYVITQGDANNTEDPQVLYKDIVGKVTIIIPNIAVWIEVIKTPKVIISIIISIVLITVLFNTPNKKMQKDKE